MFSLLCSPILFPFVVFVAAGGCMLFGTPRREQAPCLLPHTMSLPVSFFCDLNLVGVTESS